jgi:hypothetical protein
MNQTGLQAFNGTWQTTHTWVARHVDPGEVEKVKPLPRRTGLALAMTKTVLGMAPA